MDKKTVPIEHFYKLMTIIVEAFHQIQKDESILREINIKNSMQLAILTKFARDNGFNLEDSYFRSPQDILDETRKYNDSQSLLGDKIANLITEIRSGIDGCKE